MFLLIKNNDRLSVRKGKSTYPLSKKSTVYAESNYSEGKELLDTEVILMTRLRRVKPGDNVKVNKVPLKALASVIRVCKKLEGIITDANNNKVVVKLTNCGLEDHEELILNREDVTITNVSNNCKVAYFICKECGTKY